MERGLHLLPSNVILGLQVNLLLQTADTQADETVQQLVCLPIKLSRVSLPAHLLSTINVLHQKETRLQLSVLREQYSLLSPPPVRMNRIERSFFFLSSGFGGRGLEPWLRGAGSLLQEAIMVLVFLMGGAGGLSSTSPLSDIFS